MTGHGFSNTRAPTTSDVCMLLSERRAQPVSLVNVYLPGWWGRLG